VSLRHWAHKIQSDNSDTASTRLILPGPTAWRFEPVTTNDIPSRNVLDGESDIGKIGIAGPPFAHGHRHGRSFEHPIGRQSSLDLTPGSARSNSSWNGRDESDGAVSVTSAVDRGYTAAEAKYRQSTPISIPQHTTLSHGRTLAPSSEDTHDRITTNQSHGQDLAGVGVHLGTIEAQEEESELDELIRGSLEKYGGTGNKEWLPFDKLLKLVDEKNVSRELCKLVPEFLSYDKVDQYVKKICDSVIYTDKHDHELKTSCRGIFAILVLGVRVQDTLTFIDAGFSDKDLPLKRSETLRNGLCRSRFPENTVCVPGWKPAQVDLFMLYQKYMLSPFFKIPSRDSKDVFFYNLDPDIALPFIEVGDKKQHGHHGSVYMVKIHASHHDALPVQSPLFNVIIEFMLITAQVGGGEDPCFAVKQLNPRDRGIEGFKNEVTAWRKSVGNAKHPHLISLLATWHQDGSYFLLFPWANGNLRDLWQQIPQPQCEPTMVHWIATQCLGIVEALKKIHRSDSDPSDEYGIHSDIKPENILWFKDRGEGHGTLVICDFGFTQFHKRKSRSNAAPVGLSGTYRAPEIDTLRRISRAYDVWTIGCLYLEFITWYMTDLRGINLFERKRVNDDELEESGDIPSDKFFNTAKGNDAAVVKPAVSKVSLK
jgi:hypothetical protein